MCYAEWVKKRHRNGNAFVYSRKTFVFIGSFTVFLGDDMVQNCDVYPEGILVVQDEGDDDETNFKIVSFEDVLNAISECGIEDTEVQDEMINLVLLGVYGGLLLVAFGMCIYYQFCVYKRVKQPNNYLELQNK